MAAVWREPAQLARAQSVLVTVARDCICSASPGQARSWQHAPGYPADPCWRAAAARRRRGGDADLPIEHVRGDGSPRISRHPLCPAVEHAVARVPAQQARRARGGRGGAGDGERNGSDQRVSPLRPARRRPRDRAGGALWRDARSPHPRLRPPRHRDDVRGRRRAAHLGAPSAADHARHLRGDAHQPPPRRRRSRRNGAVRESARSRLPHRQYLRLAARLPPHLGGIRSGPAQRDQVPEWP